MLFWAKEIKWNAIKWGVWPYERRRFFPISIIALILLMKIYVERFYSFGRREAGQPHKVSLNIVAYTILKEAERRQMRDRYSDRKSSNEKGWENQGGIFRIWQSWRARDYGIHGRLGQPSHFTPHGTLRPMPVRQCQLTWFATIITTDFSFPCFLCSFLGARLTSHDP